MKAVAYYRVSTAAQGRSGLGLDAQKSAVDDLARQRGLALLGEFTEVESGKRNTRPQLTAALNQAKLTGAVLVIAKLDRLSRNAAFLLALRDSGVRFIAADIPDANDLTIGVLAVIAQAEREAISRRTREALAIVKQRLAEGEPYTSPRSGRPISRLGNPNGTRAIQWAMKTNDNAVAVVKAAATQRAHDLKDTIDRWKAEGVTSPSAIARHLNNAKILTARGGQWHPSTVRNIILRIENNN
ncbi:recombinase family protein [Brevundimonas diminuta]|jgi:DNA invertase Pin-like site-specific DNA recombinase|uniref:recombinase family protein n=1 Tax=Brevundimonas diminuta TaxID=293 RepID=UPI003D9A767A